MSEVRCSYCPWMIDTDADGWGFHYLPGFDLRVTWHAECFEIYEGVTVYE